MAARGARAAARAHTAHRHVCWSFRDNPELQARKGAFLQALQQLGWTDGRNAHIDYRLDGGDTSKDAAELVALAPDVIVATGSPSVSALQKTTRTVPIVFTVS